MIPPRVTPPVVAPNRSGRLVAVDPRRLVPALFLVDLAFAAGFWFTRDIGPEQLPWIRAFFALGAEWRPPAIFASTQLFLAAWLAWVCRRGERSLTWEATSLACCYMGFDELLALHESLGDAWGIVAPGAPDGTRTLQIAGIHTYPWTLLFAPLAIVLAVTLYMGMRRVLPRRLLWRLVLAGALFLCGALGFEFLQAESAAIGGHAGASTEARLALLLEETLEMVGVTLAVAVFAGYLCSGHVAAAYPLCTESHRSPAPRARTGGDHGP